VDGPPSHPHGWGSSSFFPFSRPRAALTRIMRMRKPHSCDNILNAQSSSSKDYSPRSLREGHRGTTGGGATAALAMTTSRSVSNILFHHFLPPRGEEDDSSVQRCHERLTEGGATQNRGTAIDQESGATQSPGLPASRQSSPAGISPVVFKTCGSRPAASKSSQSSLLVKNLDRSGCDDKGALAMTVQVHSEMVRSPTSCRSASPIAGCPADYTSPVPVQARTVRTIPAACASPHTVQDRMPRSSPSASPRASNASPLLVQVQTARSSPLFFSPLARPAKLVNNSPQILSGRDLSVQSLTNSPLYSSRLQGSSSAESPLNSRCRVDCISSPLNSRSRVDCTSSTNSPLYSRSRVDCTSNTNSPLYSRVDCTSNTNSPLYSRSRVDCTSSTASPLYSRIRVDCTSNTDSPLSCPRDSRNSSPGPPEPDRGQLSASSQFPKEAEDGNKKIAFGETFSRTVGGGCPGGSWAASCRRPQLQLPTPPSTAPAQKKVMISVPGAAAATAAAGGDGQRFHFGRPDRGFASSDMDVSRLECGSGGKGGKAAAAAVTDRALASSAESTPQKAGQRCRLRPRRRLELQLKKRYLRKGGNKIF
jgi:hypothetical protein